jgi:uncharacterized membrane protein YbhN (UPF0104 family)
MKEEQKGNQLVARFEHQMIGAGVLGLLVLAGLGLWGDVGKVVGQLGKFNWKVMPIVLGLTATNYWLRSKRWELFLNALKIKVDRGMSGRIFLSGLAMTVTPGRVGELMKSYFLKQFAGVKVAKTAPLVIFERLSDGLAMVVLMSGGLAVTHYGGLAVGVALGLALGFVALLHQRKLVEAGLGLVLKIPVISGTYGHLNHIYESSQELVKWRVMVPGFFLSMGAWAAEGTGFFLIIKGLGFESAMTQGQLWQIALFIFGFAAILGFATMLPGGLGVNEGTIAGLLVLLLGMAGGQAVTATLLVRLSTLWLGVGVGLVSLLRLQQMVRIRNNELGIKGG